MNVLYHREQIVKQGGVFMQREEKEKKTLYDVIDDGLTSVLTTMSGADSEPGIKIVDNIISFVSVAGGAGASTIVANFAKMAEKKNLTVLVIDMNILYPAQNVLFNVNYKDKQPDLVSFLLGEAEIGSCIVNVFLIIGLASFIRPIKVKHATIKKELPLLLTIAFAFSILMLDGLFNPLTSNTFSRKDSLVLIVLFSMFILYLVGMLFRRKRETEQVSTGKFSTIASCFLLVISIILIIYSSDLIIECAKNIASALHVSEKIITMTAIVIGTSLPELIMTVTSAKKGEFDMAIGNIIGTNIFNICIVLGLPILIYGDIVLEGFGFIDILAVFLSSFLLFIFARSERTISKKEAIIMHIY